MPIYVLASMTKKMDIKIDYNVREENFGSFVQSGKEETLTLISFD
jgi:hypothetical protein